MHKPNYDGPEWEDVVPIPQDEGGPNPIAAIAYTEEYSQASDYLRAVMANNEKSPRVLELTEHIINMNPAHYTVWVYRASILEELNVSPESELEWLTETSLRHLKNYQIWQHRQVLMSRLESLPDGETDFLAKVLDKDAKNYHVWSYRQWLVKRFNLWAEDGPDGQVELAYTEALIEDDVRNNSAWNHRHFVIFNKPGEQSLPVAVIEREIAFAKEKIAVTPQNQSPWNYLKGVLRFAKRPLSDIKPEAEKYANVDGSFAVTSSFALDILAEIWAEEKDEQKAGMALDLLGEKYDPIRRNYWNWRKTKLATVAAS